MTIINLSKILKNAKAKWKADGVSGQEVQVYEPDDESNLVLVRHLTHGGSETYYAYWTNDTDIVAKGGFGMLFKAFQLDSKAKINTDQVDFVAKVPKPPKPSRQNTNKPEEIHQEADFLNKKSINTTPSFPTKKGQVFISKNIKGLDLFDVKDKLNPIFDSLSLTQRLELFSAIALSINLIHHETLSTGEALFHKDIKGGNIRIGLRLRKKGKRDKLIEFDGEKQPIPDKECFIVKDNLITPINGYELVLDVYPIDFGISEVAKNGTNEFMLKNAGGTPRYVAIEVPANCSGGLKSDVYSLTPIFISLLKGTNIFSRKTDPYKYERFQYDDICSDFPEIKLKSFDKKNDLKRTIIAFINMMQDRNYNVRPDMDTVLRFSQLLTLFMKEYELLNKLREGYIQQKSKKTNTNTNAQQLRAIKIQENYLEAYLHELMLISEGHPLTFCEKESKETLTELMELLKKPMTPSQIIEEAELTPVEKALQIIATVKPQEKSMVKKIPLVEARNKNEMEKTVFLVNGHLPFILDDIIFQLKQNTMEERNIAGSWGFFFGIKNTELSKQRSALAAQLRKELQAIRNTLKKDGMHSTREELNQLYVAEQQVLHLLSGALKANRALHAVFARRVDKMGTLHTIIENAEHQIKNRNPANSFGL